MSFRPQGEILFINKKIPDPFRGFGITSHIKNLFGINSNGFRKEFYV